VSTRVLLWRWLGKRCCMSYHYSAIPPFWELFNRQFHIYIYIYLFIYLYSKTCPKAERE
jgi:hypothetical protein